MLMNNSLLKTVTTLVSSVSHKLKRIHLKLRGPSRLICFVLWVVRIILVYSTINTLFKKKNDNLQCTCSNEIELMQMLTFWLAEPDYCLTVSSHRPIHSILTGTQVRHRVLHCRICKVSMLLGLEPKAGKAGIAGVSVHVGTGCGGVGACGCSHRYWVECCWAVEVVEGA